MGSTGVQALKQECQGANALGPKAQRNPPKDQGVLSIITLFNRKWPKPNRASPNVAAAYQYVEVDKLDPKARTTHFNQHM